MFLITVVGTCCDRKLFSLICYLIELDRNCWENFIDIREKIWIFLKKVGFSCENERSFKNQFMKAKSTKNLWHCGAPVVMVPSNFVIGGSNCTCAEPNSKNCYANAELAFINHQNTVFNQSSTQNFMVWVERYSTLIFLFFVFTFFTRNAASFFFMQILATEISMHIFDTNSGYSSNANVWKQLKKLLNSFS